MSTTYYRCLPDYQRCCDCTLADLMLGKDCGVEILTGGESRQASPAHVPAICSAAPHAQGVRRTSGLT